MAAVLAAGLSTACHGSQAREEPPAGGGEPPAAAPALPERVPPPPPPITGEAPAELLARIRADLAIRVGAAAASLQVVRDEAVTWNDGGLGCGEPGQAYTQALVPGYWVVLGYAGREYDYRADDRGHFRLCITPDRRPPIRPPLVDQTPPQR